MRPGSGGGPVQNAKAQSNVRQNYGKSGTGAAKSPPKKPGLHGDAKSRKGSPLARKKK